MKSILALAIILSFQLSATAQLNCSWLEGTWRGEGFGGTMEEIWSAPDADGNMIGMFRYFDNESNLGFMEFWLLDSTGMKLKHFNPDMTGWEEKDGFMHFTFIESPGKMLKLDGLIYEQLSDNKIKISLDIKHEDEHIKEVFVMKKVKE